jgi:murein DD-endopeptidase MepM/ murein hydrolase activator NlpD
MQKWVFGLIVIIICLPLFSWAAKKNGAVSPVDTCTRKVNVNSQVPFDSAHSFIRSMNQQQLYSLVDYLLEMDSIPANLIEEVNNAVKDHKLEQASVIENQDDWDETHIFSSRELTDKIDTTCIINLIDEQHIGFSLPIIGVTTSNFGWRDGRNHNGIDIDLNRGDKVVSAFEGVVRFAKFQGGFGNVVVVRHANGLETLYAHLSKIKVKTGQFVSAGDLLGLGGATGHATGTHLHFEVRLKSKPINPAYIIEFTSQKLVSDKLVFKTTRVGWAVYPPDTKEYIAQKGDTLFEVAKRFGVSAKALALQNGLNQWGRLKAGKRIVIG